MPRWNPVPWATVPERIIRTKEESPIEKSPKFNGYIFKDRINWPCSEEVRMVPRICHALPLYPKTYGLSCDAPDCQHCHPETADQYSAPHRSRYRPPGKVVYDHHYRFYSRLTNRKPGTCVQGRKGCDPVKLVYLRPKKISDKPDDSKVENKINNETRHKTCRHWKAIEANGVEEEEEDDDDDGKKKMTKTTTKKTEKARDKRKDSQRLSKWEMMPTRSLIDEGSELAASDEMILPSDSWKADLWDAQVSWLASRGLLEDYEAALDDVDITMDTLQSRHDTPAYTIHHVPTKRARHTCNGARVEGEVMLDLEEPEKGTEWEWVPGSPSESFMSSWSLLDGE